MNDLSPIEERELVRLCLAEDPDAVQSFVRRFQNLVFGVCVRILGHRHDAEDVTQEVFLRAFRSLAGFDSTRAIQPWLLTIAVNRCRTHLGLRKTRPCSIDYSDETMDTRPPDHDSDLAEELQRAIETLREDYRVCFVLFHDQQLSLPEISAIIGSPVGTIKTWLHRARKQLAVYLLERGVAPVYSHELH